MDVTHNEMDTRFFLLEMTDTNYYNERLQIIRVVFEGHAFDFHMAHRPYVYPNPNYHKVLLGTIGKALEGKGIGDSRLLLPPGHLSETELAKIPFGWAFLVDFRQHNAGSNPQSGSAAFNLENINMFDRDKLEGSLGPAMDKDYTNNDKDQEDPDSLAIGIFWNHDAIMLKSRGGAITLGDQGIHIGGKVAWEYSKYNKDVMMDNSLHGIIPQTIPTALVSIPQLPNFAKFVQFADTGQKFINVAQKAGKASQAISRMI